LPSFEYLHEGERCSITGGFVYRGNVVASISGAYIYGDFCTGEIFRADFSGGEWSQEVILASGFSISSFGQDATGEIYVADLGGSVYQLVQPLQISPGSGSYLTSQVIDFAFILRKPGVSVTNLDVRVNGANITVPVEKCLREGLLEEGGLSLRCPDIPLRVLAGGVYTVSVSAMLSDGGNVSDSVTWEILENSEN
jgi:hypothetical protein